MSRALWVVPWHNLAGNRNKKISDPPPPKHTKMGRPDSRTGAFQHIKIWHPRRGCQIWTPPNTQKNRVTGFTCSQNIKIWHPRGGARYGLAKHVGRLNYIGFTNNNLSISGTLSASARYGVYQQHTRTKRCLLASRRGCPATTLAHLGALPARARNACQTEARCDARQSD